MGGTTDQPFFSVVVPTYNRADSVLDAVGRLTSMDFPSFEVIVVNDGSTDHTSSALGTIDDHRVHVITRPNGGISAARNTGVRAARGVFVVPLDDDDRPRDGWLEEFQRVLHTASAVVASCGCVLIDDTTGEPIERLRPRPLGPAFSDQVGLFLAGTFAVRRDIYLAIGGFAEGLQCSHQTEFALRLLRHCRDNDLGVASSDAEVIEIVRRAPGGRPESAPAKLLAGTEMILELHHDLLARAPATLASFHGIAGVSAFKLGDARRGRRHLWHAWRTDSSDHRRLGRLIVGWMPGGVHRHVWKS